MSFQYPEYFYIGGVIALLTAGVFAYRLWRDQKRLKILFANESNGNTENSTRRIKIIALSLFLLGSIAMSFALASPLGKTISEEVEVQASDLMVALDISNSMLAEDVKPSRLSRAKIMANEVLSSFPGKRIGLLLFAAEAYLSMPLSIDHGAAKNFLYTASPTSTSNQGTSLAAPIREYIKILEEVEPSERALLIISDGETHDEEALEAAREAREKGITIYTIGSGTKEGAKIPMEVNGKKFYKKQNSGLPVVTKFDPQFLKQLAAETGGKYYDILAGKRIVNDLEKEMQKLSNKTVKKEEFTQRKKLYQIPIGFCLLFLFLGLILNEKIFLWKN